MKVRSGLQDQICVISARLYSKKSSWSGFVTPALCSCKPNQPAPPQNTPRSDSHPAAIQECRGFSPLAKTR